MDVLPVDDLGVRNAARRLYRMRKMPDAKRLRALAERWRPYRSAASWYLWRSDEVVLPGDAAPKRPRPARKKTRPQKNLGEKNPAAKKLAAKKLAAKKLAAKKLE
jgi:hypothetical protein